MSLFDWIVPLLIIVLGTREFLPKVYHFFRPNSTDIYFEDEIELTLSDALKEEVENIVKKLKPLGFKTIGVKNEKQPLWGGTAKELTLASEESQAFACVFADRRMIRYYFFTPFTGGQSVITSYQVFKNVNKDGFLVTKITKDNPEEMLETHKKSVADFMNQGYTPFREYTWQSRIKATHLYYNSASIKKAFLIGDLVSLFLLILCYLPMLFFVLTYLYSQNQPPA
jgi:hypothetical protein